MRPKKYQLYTTFRDWCMPLEIVKSSMTSNYNLQISFSSRYVPTRAWVQDKIGLNNFCRSISYLYVILFSCNTVGTEFELGFPTQRYSAITEVPSLSYQGKGTVGQAQNLATSQAGMAETGHAGMEFWQLVLFRSVTEEKKEEKSLKFSREKVIF